MLPNDVLLKIFDFHVDHDTDEDFGRIEKTRIEVWITLTHVCRRWRSVVFYSPRHFNLRLVCTPKTPARDTLDIWPPLPLIICDRYCNDTSDMALVDNTIAALEHNDRVCKIDLGCGLGSQLKYLANSAAMQKPFPELTDLRLYGPRVKLIPDSFLGGTALRLRSLRLGGILLPGLPKLLLSATHLIHLDLDITFQYIPPEAMATSLSALTNLESLCIHFLPPPVLEIRRLPPPLTRSILPSLTKIEFNGPDEYLEEILARIDATQLNKMDILFFHEMTFDTPQLFQFISRRPTLMAPEKGLLTFNSDATIFKFSSQASVYGELRVKILLAASEWEYSSVEHDWISSLYPVPALKDLYIFEDRADPPEWQDDDTLWLDFLRSLIALKNLYVSEKIVARIVPALQELVGGRTLENIFLEGFQPSGYLHEGIEKFVAARQLTSHPVALFHWDEGSIQEEMRQYEIDNRGG